MTGTKTEKAAGIGNIRELVDRLAREAGFEVVRVTTPEAFATVSPETGGRLDRFVGLGRHGSMGWLAERLAERRSPRGLWPEVRSVIMLGKNYGPDTDPLAALVNRSAGVISCYAQGSDYHDVVKSALKRVGRDLATATDCQLKVFVDTAPVAEKPLAAAAGIGWQGKHTNLVSRQFGSWLFLGAIYSTLPLAADAAEPDHCGSCRRCLDICPTRAFPAPYELDARRCISYLTIEHAGPIPRELRTAIGNRIYGCDDCLAVCPWNHFAVAGRDLKLAARPANRAPPLAELLALDDAGFRQRFKSSPIKRTGRRRFVRNAAIAAGNSADRGLLEHILPLIEDEQPLVRGAAVWAFRQLANEDEIARLRSRHLADEPDVDVRDEWLAVETR